MRSQKTPKAKPNFRIYMKEVGKYSTTGIVLDGVTEEYLKKYTAEEIEMAKELKAKQWALYNADPTNRKEPAYTDEFYLNYAKSVCYQQIVGSVREIADRKLSHYDIKDVYWAQFSYEEILQMEDDGYDIPKDVIEWAHAQQQSDVTDYIVVSDANETDDNSDTSDATSADQLAKYRAQSINDIAKIEKAEKETEKNIIEYEETKSNAKSVRAQSRFFQDLEFKKLEEKTKEWKKLNEKKEAGKLSKFDEMKFKSLTKELQGGEGGVMSAIEANAAELNEFLEQLNVLDEKIAENNELVTEAVQNATDLTNIQKQYAPSHLPIPMRGIKIDGNGLSTSTLYGIRIEDIPKVAIEKSRDLDHIDRFIVNKMSSQSTQKLVNFADQYTDRVQEVTNKTKGIVGESEDKSSKENDKKKKSENNENYKVLKIFSAANSVIATATTISATADMKAKQKNAEKQEKDLKKEVTKANDDARALSRQASSVSSEHESNLSEEEIFLMQLDELNGSEESETQESVAEETESETEQINVTSQTDETTEDKTSKKETLIEKINAIHQRDKASLKETLKLFQKGKVSNAKSKAFTRILRGGTTTFEQARKTAIKVAKDTTVVGIGTTVLGHYNSLIGSALISSGTAMTASIYPPTVIAGLKMIAVGATFVKLGTDEILTGSIATVTGAETSDIALAAKSVTDSSQATDKTSQAAIKENDATIAESQNAVGIEATPAQSGTSSSSQAQTSGESGSTVVVETTESALTTETSEETTTAEISGNSEIAGTEEGLVVSAQAQGETTEIEKPEEEAEESKIPASSTNTSVSDSTSISLNNEINNKQTTTAGKVSDSQEKDTEQRNKNADDRNNNDKQETTNIYNVAKDFSIPGSINAIRITAKATQDAMSRKTTTENRQQALNTSVANIDQNYKNVEKFQKEAESESKVIVNRAAQAKAQIEIETGNIKNAAEQYNEEDLLQAQNNVQYQVSQVAEMNAKGLARLDSGISSVNRNLKTAQGIQSSLNSELISFSDLLRQQYLASTDTIAVGFGTHGMGMLHTAEGIGLYTSGQALVASAGINPVQHALGLSMMANGTVMIGYGNQEQIIGLTATAAGVQGTVANAVMNLTKTEGEEASKTHRTFLSITSENVRKNVQASQEIANNETQSIDEVNAIAASATANANSVEIYDTDDKADKRLARFNKETEIESRRKRKRVNAVSASTRG